MSYNFANQDKLNSVWAAFDAQYPEFFVERTINEDALPVLSHYINTVACDKADLADGEVIAFIAMKGTEKEAARDKSATVVEQPVDEVKPEITAASDILSDLGIITEAVEA